MKGGIENPAAGTAGYRRTRLQHIRVLTDLSPFRLEIESSRKAEITWLRNGYAIYDADPIGSGKIGRVFVEEIRDIQLQFDRHGIVKGAERVASQQIEHRFAVAKEDVVVRIATQSGFAYKASASADIESLESAFGKFVVGKQSRRMFT